jgi:hypothetical protein
MLFALVVGLNKFLAGRRYRPGAVCLAFGVITPLVIGSFIMGLDTSSAYLKMTGIGRGGFIATFTWCGIYAYFVAIIAFLAGQRAVHTDAATAETAESVHARPRLLFLAIALLITAGVSYSTLDRHARTFRRICSYFQREAWGLTVRAARKYPRANFTPGICRKLNRALYEENRLGREMFRYPQTLFGGLLIGPELQEPYKDDTLLQLGLVESSKRLAEQSLEKWGARPVVLRLLVKIALVNDNEIEAEKWLELLSKDIGHKLVAGPQLDRLRAGQQIGKKEEILRIRSFRTPVRIQNPLQRQNVLQALLRHNSDNRMAFEYLMAHYLVTADLDGFAANAYRIAAFDYEYIPDHYAEALTLIHNQTGRQLDTNALKTSPGVLETCQRFNALYRQHKNNPQALAQAVAREMPYTYFGYYYALQTPQVDVAYFQTIRPAGLHKTPDVLSRNFRPAGPAN